MSLNSKFLLVGGRLTQLVSSFFYILTCILLLNTPEINYLHYLIEVNHQTSHFGQVYGVHIDGRKILGTEKFEVPLDNSWLIYFVIHEIEKNNQILEEHKWGFPMAPKKGHILNIFYSKSVFKTNSHFRSRTL